MQDPQQDALDFLADPATHGGAAVTRIDTHAASVFLAGDRALKIKRAVRFPFLDFSTLAKRKAACEVELSVNRAFAPQLYRRVAPITRGADGRLALGGGGEPVEWALEMARFDETQTLDRVAGERGIDSALSDRLGRAVAAAHDAARQAYDFGFADMLKEIVAQNEAELRSFPTLFEADAVAALTRRARETLVRLRPLLDARARDGQVRRCHSDLHLGNIVLIEGRPVVFDAIEFDDRIATVDVLYDLAFLLMDLWQRDLHAAANAVLNRYLVETGRDCDLDALAALPLFLSTRAAIRAKVTAERKDSGAADMQRARGYFALACRVIAPPPPRLIAVAGLSGTGKSALARTLAPEIPPAPGAVVLRSDQQRKHLLGVAETERLPAEAYTEAATARVYAALSEKAARVLRAGHAAIVDAVFARAPEREAIEAASAGGPFTGLFLTADLDTRIARVGGRVEDASDADAAVVRAQEEYDLGRLDWAQVDASGTPADTLARARTVLKHGATHASGGRPPPTPTHSARAQSDA